MKPGINNVVSTGTNILNNIAFIVLYGLREVRKVLWWNVQLQCFFFSYGGLIWHSHAKPKQMRSTFKHRSLFFTSKTITLISDQNFSLSFTKLNPPCLKEIFIVFNEITYWFVSTQEITKEPNKFFYSLTWWKSSAVRPSPFPGSQYFVASLVYTPTKASISVTLYIIVTTVRLTMWHESSRRRISSQTKSTCSVTLASGYIC